MKNHVIFTYMLTRIKLISEIWFNYSLKFKPFLKYAFTTLNNSSKNGEPPCQQILVLMMFQWYNFWNFIWFCTSKLEKMFIYKALYARLAVQIAPWFPSAAPRIVPLLAAPPATLAMVWAFFSQCRSSFYSGSTHIGEKGNEL